MVTKYFCDWCGTEIEGKVLGKGASWDELHHCWIDDYGRLQRSGHVICEECRTSLEEAAKSISKLKEVFGK